MAEQVVKHLSKEINNILRVKEGGYTVSLFVNKNKASRYQCGLCTQICYNAVELSCYECNEDDNNDDDKQYCELCLKTYLNENNFTCPVNKDHKNVTYKTNSIQCQYIQDKVNHLIIYCPTSNHSSNAEEGSQLEITHKQNDDEKKQINDSISCCSWKGKLNTLSAHLNNDCQVYEKPTSCSYIKYGCNYIGGAKQLEIHNAENISHHMDLLCNVVDVLKHENKELKAENKIFVDIIKASDGKITCQLDALKLEIQQQMDLHHERENHNIMEVVNVLKTQMEYVQQNLNVLTESVHNMQSESKYNQSEQKVVSQNDVSLYENKNDSIYCKNYKNMILSLATDKMEIKQGLVELFTLWEGMILKNENELGVEKLKSGFKALSFFLSKIVKNPFMKQIRKMNVYNKQYKERISVLPNIERLFVLIGYERDDAFWILPLLYDKYGENNDENCKEMHNKQIVFLNGFKDVLSVLFNVENKYELKQEEYKNELNVNVKSESNIPQTQYSNRFMEIAKLIQQGKKPNDIQIFDDMPPDPNAPPSESKMEQKKKPFQMDNNNSNDKNDGINWFEQYEAKLNVMNDVDPGGHGDDVSFD